MLFLWQILEKLSHHRCGIPVDFGSVLEHLLAGIEFRRCSSSMVEFDVWHIVHSLDSFMPVFLK